MNRYAIKTDYSIPPIRYLLASDNNYYSIYSNIEDSSVRQLQQEDEGRLPPSEGRLPPSEGRPPPSDNNILVHTQSVHRRNNGQGAGLDNDRRGNHRMELYSDIDRHGNQRAELHSDIDRHGNQRAELYTSFSDSDGCGDHGNQEAELYRSFSDNDGHGESYGLNEIVRSG